MKKAQLNAAHLAKMVKVTPTLISGPNGHVFDVFIHTETYRFHADPYIDTHSHTNESGYPTARDCIENQRRLAFARNIQEPKGLRHLLSLETLTEEFVYVSKCANWFVRDKDIKDMQVCDMEDGPYMDNLIDYDEVPLHQPEHWPLHVLLTDQEFDTLRGELSKVAMQKLAKQLAAQGKAAK